MPVQLSHQELMELQREGYSQKEINEAINEIEKEDIWGLSSSRELKKTT